MYFPNLQFGKSFNLGFEVDTVLVWSTLLRISCFVFVEGVAESHLV